MLARRHARSALRALGLDLINRPTSRRLPQTLVRVKPIGPIGARPTDAQLFKVATDRCTSFAGLPFLAGWNPLVVTLREYMSDDSLLYEDSTLSHVHQSFHPHTVQEFSSPWAGNLTGTHI